MLGRETSFKNVLCSDLNYFYKYNSKYKKQKYNVKYEKIYFLGLVVDPSSVFIGAIGNGQQKWSSHQKCSQNLLGEALCNPEVTHQTIAIAIVRFDFFPFRWRQKAQPPQPQQSQVLRLLLDSSELSLIRSQWMYENSGYKRSLDMLNFSKHFRELW